MVATLAHLIRVLAIVAARNELRTRAHLLVTSPRPKAKVCARSATLHSPKASKSDFMLDFDHVIELAGGLILAVDAETRLYRLRTHLHDVMGYAGGQPALIHEVLSAV